MSADDWDGGSYHGCAVPILVAHPGSKPNEGKEMSDLTTRAAEVLTAQKARDEELTALQDEYSEALEGLGNEESELAERRVALSTAFQSKRKEINDRYRESVGTADQSPF